MVSLTVDHGQSSLVADSVDSVTVLHQSSLVTVSLTVNRGQSSLVADSTDSTDSQTVHLVSVSRTVHRFSLVADSVDSRTVHQSSLIAVS